jgi:hypothetical protein
VPEPNTELMVGKLKISLIYAEAELIFPAVRLLHFFLYYRDDPGGLLARISDTFHDDV